MYDEQLGPHVQAFLSPSVEAMFSFSALETMLPILLKCGWALSTMREDIKLETLLEGIYKVLKIAPSDPSQKHMRIWDLSVWSMGYMGHPSQAVALLEYVVKVRETHPDRLSSQHELAVAYYNNRQTEKAVSLLEHVVKIKETTLAETHPSRLVSQHALAIVYNASGQSEKALVLLKHVVAVESRDLSEDNPSRLISIRALQAIESQLAIGEHKV